jgi:hypothetical protein
LDGGEDGRRRAAAPELPEEAYTQETAEDADFIDDEGACRLSGGAPAGRRCA